MVRLIAAIFLFASIFSSVLGAPVVSDPLDTAVAVRQYNSNPGGNYNGPGE